MNDADNLILSDCQFDSDPKGKGLPIIPLIPSKGPLIYPMSLVERDSDVNIKSREEMIAEMRERFYEGERMPYTQGYVPVFVSNANFNPIAIVPSSNHCNHVSVARATRLGLLPRTSKNAVTNSVTDNHIGAALGVERKGVAPFDLLKKVKQTYILYVIDSKLYRYDYQSNCYIETKQDHMERLIWLVCPEEVELAGSKNILTGTYNLLMVDPDLYGVKASDYVDIIPFMNGLLRLDTMEFTPPSPQFFITYSLQCNFPNPLITSVECPLFDKYLWDVSGGDVQLIARIWEIIGLCLTADANAKVIIVFQGITDSGKSVLTNVIKSFYPTHMQTAMDAHSMDKQFAMKALIGKLLCICSDMSPKALSNDAVSNFKKLSGRDSVNTDIKFQDSVDFDFKGKIILVTNNPLIIKQDDPAFWGRIITVPFRYKLPEEKKIYGLDQLLQAELPAIASRAINAYIHLKQNGYLFSGNYSINEVYSSSTNQGVTDNGTLIFDYLKSYYEICSESIVITEEACADFNRIYAKSLNTLQFSPLFNKHAMDLFNTKKTRSHVGYSNARSAVKGIRRKIIIEQGGN